jgi:hypothetical protein
MFPRGGDGALRFRRLQVASLESRRTLNGSGLPGDLNADGVVNGLDVAVVSSSWMHTGPQPLTGDVNADGIVNGLDIAFVSPDWLNTAGPLTITAPGAQSVAVIGSLAVNGIALSDPYLPTSDDVTLMLAVAKGTVDLSRANASRPRLLTLGAVTRRA